MESRLVKMYPESQAATTPVSLVVVFPVLDNNNCQ